MSARLARWATTTSRASLRFPPGLCVTVAVIVATAAAQSAIDREVSRALEQASSGDFAGAEQVLRSLEKAHLREFEVRYRLGLILLRQGKHLEAAARFDAANKIAPGSALGWLGSAQARLKLGKKKEALDAASRAAKLASSDAPVWRALAIVYAEAGEFARAAEFEERWGRASPVDARSPARLCEFRVRAGDPAARVACRQAIERGESPALYGWLGQAYRLARDPARAAEAFQNAIRLAPDQPDAYFALAGMLLDHRTSEPAVALLSSAAARFPKEPEIHRLLGLAHYQSGDTGKAIDAFFSACDLDPDSETSYASFETLLSDAGPRKTEIIGRLSEFQKRNPSSPVGHYLLAKAGVGDAEGHLRDAIRVEPRFWPAHYELGQLLDGRGDSGAAAAALKEAVRLNPEFAPAHYSLAQIYSRLGDRKLAVAHRSAHHKLLNQERQRADQRREQSPALAYRIDSEGERRPTQDQK